MIPGTIEEDIENGLALARSHRKFNGSTQINYSVTGETIRVPADSLINKYKHLIDPFVAKIKMTESLRTMYRFAPKRVSMDLYGTTQYWSIILYLNGCHSLLDFDPDILKFIQADKIDEIINEILILEGVS